jgi:hypothetical protein
MAYKRCPTCGSVEHGETIYRCKECNTIFCGNCITWESRIFSSGRLSCPSCGKDDFTSTNKIENIVEDDDKEWERRREMEEEIDRQRDVDLEIEMHKFRERQREGEKKSGAYSMSLFVDDSFKHTYASSTEVVKITNPESKTSNRLSEEKSPVNEISTKIIKPTLTHKSRNKGLIILVVCTLVFILAINLFNETKDLPLGDTKGAFGPLFSVLIMIGCVIGAFVGIAFLTIED